jgi:hypothetical protein
MERNVLKRKWNILFNELKERWPDLTQSDVNYIYGDKTKLRDVVQIRRHISQADATRDVEAFLKSLELRQRMV